MIFVKLLMKFLFSLLFNKGEYEVSHKNFNPIRVLLIPMIIVYAVWVTVRLTEYHEIIEENCKSCMEILNKDSGDESDESVE